MRQPGQMQSVSCDTKAVVGTITSAQDPEPDSICPSCITVPAERNYWSFFSKVAGSSPASINSLENTCFFILSVLLFFCSLGKE